MHIYITAWVCTEVSSGENNSSETDGRTEDAMINITVRNSVIGKLGPQYETMIGAPPAEVRVERSSCCSTGSPAPACSTPADIA